MYMQTKPCTRVPSYIRRGDSRPSSCALIYQTWGQHQQVRAHVYACDVYACASPSPPAHKHT